VRTTPDAHRCAPALGENMRKPIRVLVITPFLWSGAGKAIVRLIQDLKLRGYDFELVSSGRSRGLSDWPEYVRALREARILHHKIDFFDRTPERFWQSVLELTELIQSRQIDMVHVHAGVPAFAAVAARDRLNAKFPIVATFHSWNPDRPSWMNHSDVWALNRCNCVVTDSLSYQNQLESWGLNKEKTETIHLGVDIPSHRDLAARNQLTRHFRILSVGRLEPRKDQETLLRGFALFKKRFPKAELGLAGPVGDQKYNSQLRQRATRYGWDLGVRFLGKVRKLDALYCKANLFVSTSRDEGLGLAVLEAMSYGLPVICTPVTGHTDFVEDGRNARLIPVGDFKRLAQSIGELQSNPNLCIRLGENARHTISCQFSWAATVEKYVAVFRKMPTPVLSHSHS